MLLRLVKCQNDSPHSTPPASGRLSLQQLNSTLSDMQWLEASVPNRDGGLEVRRVSTLTLPAFLASAASTHSVQTEILSVALQSMHRVFTPWYANTHQAESPGIR